MPDEFDQAALVELQFRDDALRKQARSHPIGDPARWQATSATHCLKDECGVAIPEERRKALPGVMFCVECQQRLERKGMR